jgi:hypothetical protein
MSHPEPRGLRRWMLAMRDTEIFMERHDRNAYADAPLA